MLNRWLLAALALALSVLQAWDSHALGAEPAAIAGIALVILLIPVTIVWSRHPGRRFAVAAVAVICFSAIRLLSSAHLPELALAGVFPALLVLMDYLAGRQSRPADTRS